MGIWDFISDSANQKTLAWAGGGLLVVTSGLWAAFLQLRKPSPASPPPKPTQSAQAGDGIAATGNVRIDGGVSINKTEMPKALYGLAALGLVMIGFAIFFAGGTTVCDGVNAGGDISGSDVVVTSTNTNVDC